MSGDSGPEASGGTRDAAMPAGSLAKAVASRSASGQRAARRARRPSARTGDGLRARVRRLHPRGPIYQVRVVLPDPATGEHVARRRRPRRSGMVRPDGRPRSRGTAADAARGRRRRRRSRCRTSSASRSRPASSWAEPTRPGAELVIVGGRRNQAAPEQDIDGALLICDEQRRGGRSRWVRRDPRRNAR